MNINRLTENSMADIGIDHITDTEKHEVTSPTIFVGLMVTSEITIDEIDEENNTGNTLVGAVIPTGMVIPFRFRSIKLSGGTAIAVKGA